MDPAVRGLLIFCMNAADLEGARLLPGPVQHTAVVFRSWEGVLTLRIAHSHLNEEQGQQLGTETQTVFQSEIP